MYNRFNNITLKQEKENGFPTVSIIVLNYNGKQYLDACFDSISKISFPKEKYEVLMIDNCSIDGSVEHVRKIHSWVRVIPLKRNYGFTGGNNIGVKYANGDYVVLLNNDVVVDKNWLTELVKIGTDDPASIVTSKALFLYMPDVINYDGSKATLIGRGFCPNCGKKDKVSKDFSDPPRFVVQPYGASMLIRREVFEEIGGFDEDYFTSLEDLDLGLRAWLYGHNVIYAPSSVFYHVGGGTAGKGSHLISAIVYHTTKNSYMNILKYFDLPHILIGLVFSLIYYISTAIWLTRKTKKLQGARLILLGHIWVLKNLSSIIKKRAIIQKRRVLRPSLLFRRDFFAPPSEMIKAYIRLSSLLERLP